MMDVRERQRFEAGFFNCRAIQLSLALQEWGMPVEALYYNAWESTKEIYEHLYVKKSKPWFYRSPCLEPSELGLIGIPYEQVPYADDEEIAPLLQRIDYSASAAFLWISCGEAPYAKPGTFGDPEAVHSIWVCGWSPEPSGSGRYAIRDTYPDYEGDISEEDLRRMCKVPALNTEDRAVFLMRKPEAKASPDWNRIRERYAERMARQQGDTAYYEIVRTYASGGGTGPFASLAELYDCHAHAFKFIAGSRYAFSCFVEAAEGDRSLAEILRGIARKADMLKSFFLMAIHGGSANAAIIAQLCSEIQELEELAWRRIASPSGGAHNIAPQVTNSLA